MSPALPVGPGSFRRREGNRTMNSDTQEFRLGEGRLSGVLSLVLGLLALGGVLCFRYPGILSVPTVRERFDIPLLRNVLFLAIALSLLMAAVGFVLQRRIGFWFFGMLSAVSAIVLGGADAVAATDARLALPIGLDWFVIDLLLSAILFVPLERIFAQRKQFVLRPEWSTDLSYFAMTHLLIQVVILVTTFFAVVHLRGLVIEPTRRLVAPLPFVLAFPLAVFVADLLQVTVHRAFHRVPFLWRFHAVHHSAAHMDWLAGSRLHLAEVLITRMMVFLPLFLLGFEPPVLYAYIGLVGIQATWVHANLNWDLGPLEHVFVTPRYHHWHHAKDPAYVDANYAIHLPIVDRLLGTHRLPARGWPEAFGTLNDEVPPGIVAQHLFPFRGESSPTIQ